MSTPYIGEIRIFAGNFPPRGYQFCAGQLLPISQYSALFALIGTTYGGDGQTTFGLPDLRGRVPMHQGTGPGLTTRTLGQSFGTETVTLTSAQMPAHGHGVLCNNGTGVTNPANGFWAQTSGVSGYGAPATANASVNAGSIGNSGGNQPHNNLMPLLSLNFIIALEGVFPSRN